MTTQTHTHTSAPKTSAWIFWGISSFEALAMFRRGLFYTYMSVYLRYFLGLTVTETTFFATFPMLLNIFFQTLIWGPLSDRYQRRRTLIVYGELCAGLGTLLVWYAHTLPDSQRAAGYVIIIGLCAVESFWSMSNIGKSALLSDLYHQEERSTVRGRLASVGGVGRIAGIWIGGLLYDGLGRHFEGWGFSQGVLFFIASGIMFLSIVPMLCVPEGGIRRGARKAEEDSEHDAAPPTASSHLFFVFLAAMMFINFGRNSVAIIRAQYLMLESGFAVSSQTLSYVMNAESVAMILFGVLVGRLGKRLGNGRALLFGAAVAIAALLFFVFGPDIRFMYLSNFLRGASDVTILATSYAFASVLIPPGKRARYFSLFNATLFLSWGLAGTFLAGPLVDWLIAAGSTEIFAYRMAFLAAAVMTAVGVLIQGVLVYGLLPRTSVGQDRRNGL